MNADSDTDCTGEELLRSGTNGKLALALIIACHWFEST